jgi:hypothetical protein
MREHRSRCLRPPLLRENLDKTTCRRQILGVGRTSARLWECLSRMQGNLHARFLGEVAAATLQPYPLF